MTFEDLRGMVTDALRYWEPRRLLYNGLLAGIVVVLFSLNWPVSRQDLGFNNVLGLFLLAVLSNVAYCAAYPVDLFLQISHFREQRRFWRTGVLTVGFAFAAVLTYFFSAATFSSVH